MQGVNKIEIKNAIEELFNVNVVSINVVNVRKSTSWVNMMDSLQQFVKQLLHCKKDKP